MPIYYRYFGNPNATLNVWTGHEEACSYIEDLCGRIEDQAEIENILLTHSARNPHSSVAACIYGHTHIDSFLAPLETTEFQQHKLPFYQIEITCLDTKRNIALRKTNKLGIAFDILVLTPSKRRLTLIRFGDGTDREFYY